MPKLSLVFFFIAASILATVHSIALKLALYWQHAWFDIPMHALGGAVAALSVFAVHDLIKKFPVRFLYPVPVLSFVLVVALVWEVYEIGVGIPIEDNFETDTLLDIFMGLVGGTVGYIVGYAISMLDIEHDYETGT